MTRKSWASWFAGNVRRYSAKPQHVHGFLYGKPVDRNLRLLVANATYEDTLALIDTYEAEGFDAAAELRREQLLAEIAKANA